MKKSTTTLSTLAADADTRLLVAARSAALEGGSFTNIYQTVGAVSGALELLEQMIQGDGDVPKDVNWSAVADLLADCGRRLGGVHCALGELAAFERHAPETVINSAEFC